MVTDRMLITNAAAKMQELFLHTSPPTNAREFRHPLTLLRLAQFVRDATKVRLRTSQLLQYGLLILSGGWNRWDGMRNHTALRVCWRQSYLFPCQPVMRMDPAVVPLYGCITGMGRTVAAAVMVAFHCFLASDDHSTACSS
jgi:hypothetical protein